MNNRVNPNLPKELSEFGISDWNECYHCGTCTAICPLTSQGVLFPRKEIRLMQMGLKDALSASVEPWLCYYCGECSQTCPRNANPGELMMSLRRYLTSLYDWTGLSKKFYTSKIWEVGFIIFFAILVVLAFIFVLPPLDTTLTPEGGVKVNSFAPIKLVEYFDWAMALVVAGLLVSNIFRMYLLTVWKGNPSGASLFVHIKEFWLLIYNFVVQPKFSKCEEKSYWLYHWLLMSGYTIMFILIVVYLPWFQTEEIHAPWHLQRLLGYYATIGLLIGLGAAIIGRFKKVKVKFQFSHVSDWLFLIMLTLTVITGILIHIFRINGMPWATYISYIIHMAVLVPMILIEVPFSKWSHLAYRPFAVYFSRIKNASVNVKS
jgi:ferredoxin